MDFIEKIFGFAPDNGDGSLEAMLIGAAVIACVMIIFRRRIARALWRKPSAR